MANRADGNVHTIEFREAKPSQGDAARPVSELFSLEERTVIGEYFLYCPNLYFTTHLKICSHRREWIFRHNTGNCDHGERW